MAAPSVLIPSRERHGWLDRCLSIVTDVEAGEGSHALLLAGNMAILLAAYYILKTVRESLILTEGGAEIKSYSAAAQALLLLLIVPAYGAFGSKVNCFRLISWCNLFFISHLLVFFFLGVGGVHVGKPFFIWVGIFNVLVIAQFWAFATDVYNEQQGTRLFPLLGVGSALGAWGGALLAARLFSILGPYPLMLLAGAMLLVCILPCYMALRKGSSGNESLRQCLLVEPLEKKGGFQLVFSDRYLFLIAMLILLLNVVNTTGEFMLGKVVLQEADRLVGSGPEAEHLKQAFIGKFYGEFFGWVNLFGLLFQLFLVSRIFKYVGVGGSLFILPIISLGGYSLLATLPLLGIVRIAKVLENSANYSIQNTARHALFLPTSREAKYKAKTAIETFFWRAGDVLQAVVVFIGARLAFEVADYAVVNIVLVALWLLVAVGIYHEHKKISSCRQVAVASTCQGD